jgi:saccharopine dehydrogenase-like NADP-dependent oxidoreductase
MTKAIVMGGCGEIGKSVVYDLLEYSDFDHIVVADIREAKGKAFVKELNTDRVSFRRTDAYNHQDMVDAMKGFDIVINTIGPFYEFAFLVAQAALQAEVNYIDVCDDPDATISLLSLGDLARRKDLTFVINCGWTPGIMNMLAKKGAEQMDKVEEIRLNWVQDLEEEIGLAPIMHWGHITAGSVITYRDGRWIEVPGLSEREEVSFPDPVGVVPLYHTGHPETITLPRYIDARNVSLKGGLVPPELVTLTKIVEAMRLAQTKRRLRLTARFFLPLLPFLSKIGGKTPGISASRVEIKGKKESQPIRVVYGMLLKVSKATASSASIAAQMVTKGQIERRGVSPPEACINIAPYFEELEKRGLSIIEME